MPDIPRATLFLAALVACLASLCGGPVSFGGDRLSPPFVGPSLPESPQQNATWTAPDADLPAAFVTATEALFQAGMADPRGCEYRAIEVGTGSCWSGDGGVVATHGWVLPARDGEKTAFAVCWNGLVYPAASVGDKADLKIDVLALVKADEEMRAKYSKEGPKSTFYRYRQAWSEGESVSHQSLLPGKACLLLRLGEGELARRLWETWTAGMNPGTNDDAVHLKDPYLMLATDWVWALYDRAVCAHMRADDHLALASARALVPVEKAVAAEAKKRGFKKERDGFGAAKADEHPYLDFLEALPELLADQERRAKDPGRSPNILTEKDKDKRIAALIRDLDEVAARQDGQPGGVSLAWDSRVQALIQEGDAAVEPLLRCLEEDTRLTRSVHFWRDFARHRSILGVHEAAYVALSGILQTSFFGTASTGDDLSARGMEGRRATAEAIRAYWNKFKGKPLEERWYAILADDQASPDQWLQAAGNIVQPVDVSVTPASMFGAGWVSVPARAPGDKPKIRGEALRDKKDPSVADLMSKRIDIICEMGEPGSRRMWANQQACALAKDLARWDEKAAVPHLRRMFQECRKGLAGEKGEPSLGWDFNQVGREIAQLSRLRTKAGDASALEDYAAWVRTIQPTAASHSFKDVLSLLWENPDHPAIAAAAEAMFDDEQSPWTRKFLRAFNTEDLAQSPLVGMDAFRKRLLVELTNVEQAGSIILREDGEGSVEVDNGYKGGAGIGSQGDPLAPKAGTTRFRVCDFYAWQLSALGGMPRCQLYWPEARRDQAVASCAAALRQYGKRFQYSAAQRALWTWPDDAKAVMTFGPLEHPATAEEVKNGLAVFSLEGEGEARLGKLPVSPRAARWTTLKDSPYGVQRYNTKTLAAERGIEYEQDGRVWQAEEVLKDGKWERYYGFVGAHRVARAPAAEVEFPPEDPYFWDSLSRGVDCRVGGPGTVDADGRITFPRLGVGGPLVVPVKLRNRLGVEQTVPAELVRKDAEGRATLHAGLEIRLRYAPAQEDIVQGAPKPPPPKEADWQELAPREKARMAQDAAARTAEPGEEFADFRIDLRDFFKIDKEGDYRLQLLFHSRDGGFADGETRVTPFSLAPAAEGKKP